MKVQQFKSLVEFARKAPMDENYTKTIRDSALGAVDQAIDTFFQSDREVSVGEKAYNDLTDVQLAFKTIKSRTRGQMKANASEAEFTADIIALPHKTTVDKTGETDRSRYGRDFIAGIETTQYTKAVVAPPRAPSFQPHDDMSKLMDQVLPLYASVAMVPGPLSVSMKDQIQTLVEFGGNSQARGSSSQSSEALGLMGYSQSSSSSSFRASSRHSGFAQSMTVDERVMPQLQKMKRLIKGLATTEPVDANIVAKGQITNQGQLRRTESTGFLGLSSKEVLQDHTVVVDRYHSKHIGTAPYIPSYPTFTNGIQEAKSPMAKAAQTEEIGPELLEKLQTEGAQALAEAVTVLFNPSREVESGRAAYDKLSDLSDALTILDRRQGGHKSYGRTGVSQIASSVESLSPLYASVAMVPGTMSSSVKNFAKEVAEFKSRSSSRSSSGSSSKSWSLLGYKAGGSSSSSSSSSNEHVRRETTTTDERIMTPLHQIKTRLFEMHWDGEKIAAPAYRE